MNITKNSKYYSPDQVLEKLDLSIQSIVNNIQCYCLRPNFDFTRNRLISASDIIKFVLGLEAKSAACEAVSFFASHDHLPSESAIYQQRCKLLYDAFSRINDLFVSCFDNYKTINGYRILAQDGSDINIPFMEDETVVTPGNQTPYCQYHLNALFDCLNHVFVAMNIDLPSKTREVNALIDLTKKLKLPYKHIVICDRGYESYKLIKHFNDLETKFIIRVKDTSSKTGIMSNVECPDGAFDINVIKKLTKLQTKVIKESREYIFVPSTSESDYFGDSDFLELAFRVVRFKISEDTYETLITNLSNEDFTLEDFIELYHLRWEEETGFKILKYAVGMIYFHSKNRELIKQEIVASIIVYNFTSILILNEDIQITADKYTYKSNISTSITAVRLFLKRIIKASVIMETIKKYLIPIRPGRRLKRKIKRGSTKPFSYRPS